MGMENKFKNYENGSKGSLHSNDKVFGEQTKVLEAKDSSTCSTILLAVTGHRWLVGDVVDSYLKNMFFRNLKNICLSCRSQIKSKIQNFLFIAFH